MKSNEVLLEEKKKMIVDAGLRLHESGLIARTWGNISYRIDDSSFLITPSGRSYLTLTPEEIVTIKISDLSYDGEIKPSSEKGVHAKVYSLFPDMNFVIHTHQINASAISATGLRTFHVHEGYSTLNASVHIAEYALPGTKKLMAHVERALKLSSGQAVIMENHGALCFGKSYEEAFETAEALEYASQDFIYEQYHKKSGYQDQDDSRLSHFAISKYLGTLSKYKEINTVTDLNSDEILNASVHKSYKSNPFKILVQSPEIMALSQYDYKLKPFLDDYAQIAGHNVVMVKNLGAICYGRDENEAQAVALVTQKNGKAFIAAALFENVKPIHPIESLLMRLVYKTKYSKQAENKGGI